MMSSKSHLGQPSWHHALFRFLAAFLLGVPVGFLFRPFSTQNASLLGPIPPTPPLLSFWGIWQFPVMLFWVIMLIKIAYTFISQKGGLSGWSVIFSSITLLASLFLLLYGIAPLDQLKWMHLYWDIPAIWYQLLNPFVIGLAASFILEDISQSSFSLGRALLTACLSWLGTATCFLVVVEVYIQVVSPLCFHWFCEAGALPNLAPFWISGGLIIALGGGSIGGLLSHALLGKRGGEKEIPVHS